LFFLLLVTLLTGQASASAPKTDFTPPQSGTVSSSTYTAPDKYDPRRDPEKDLAAAEAEAKTSNRNIIVIVGGDWCSWCHIMDDFFHEHRDVTALREKNYVLMKLNMSQENPNRDFLSRFPRIHGYPHIFILDADGKLVQSQPTNVLEDGHSYNVKRFKKFLEDFAPKPSV
jgi:thiol:disulfide interchange protein